MYVEILNEKEAALLVNGVKDLILTLHGYKQNWMMMSCGTSLTLIDEFSKSFEDRVVKPFGDVCGKYIICLYIYQ